MIDKEAAVLIQVYVTDDDGPFFEELPARKIYKNLDDDEDETLLYWWLEN
ncbi:hypothetical protein HUT27_17100 [Pseudomonas chlororaphis]|nr:hypothetical protein [Pseudomonas chlororaphis]MBP5064170.1 hypothetical protein [Pseudomonas chlororaphis]QTT95141.1 hypothetical protein HUT27_17100 [Pseudomonas chlororaphis]